MPNTCNQTMGCLYSLDCSAVPTTLISENETFSFLEFGHQSLLLVDVELHKYVFYVVNIIYGRQIPQTAFDFKLCQFSIIKEPESLKE